MKPALFHRAALDTIQTFPEAVRKELGKAIFDPQKGELLGMPVSRPMPSVGPGIEELRIRDRGGSYRAFYFSRCERGILVFHAFIKKTRGTSKQDIATGKTRLKELRDES